MSGTYPVGILRSTRTRLVVVVGLVLLVVAAVWWLDGADEAPATTAVLPTTAAAVYPDGASTTDFENVGEMVATAAVAFEGKVVSADAGAPVLLSDGSGSQIVPRILSVEVRKVFHTRSKATQVPATLLVTDGYWEDGVGYERESIGWAQPGQTGFFLVSRDRGPDGSLLPTYSPLDGNGIALVDGGRVEYAHHGVWRDLGPSSTPAVFRGAVSQAARDARNGAAKPVPVTFCYPSVPGDENSEPICVEE